MKNIFVLFLLISFCMNDSFSQAPLYQSDEFSLYPDRVIQGNFIGQAVSRNHIQSNYSSPANEFQSADMVFKFAVNGRDNEMPPGVDHVFSIPVGSARMESPVITFGQPLKKTSTAQQFLPPNTPVKIKLDFREPLKQLNEKGFFLSYSGQKIFKSDFKGVFIAGGTAPLSWDFDNLDRREECKMKDPDGDGIYEIELVLNSHTDEKKTASSWKVLKDILPYPAYQSDFPISDAIYNMSLDEMITAIEPDNTFRTGKEWAGVWTRDISYSILLSMAILQPEVAKTSLRKKVKNNRVIQDTGTGGAWPVSSDRMIWAVAAFEIYKVTGDKEWLKYAYTVVRNSVDDDKQVAFDPQTGLMKGESSFLDWREQTYPRWMQPADIYESACLGTNAAHYQATRVLANMAGLMNDPAARTKYNTMADGIKAAINQHFWVEGKGYYGQFIYGRNTKILSPKSEALGEALSVWFGITDANRARKVVESTPVGAFGIPCIFPQIPGILPYHNRAVWPFVQSYWALAAAKAGNEKSLMESIAAIYRPAALFVTNKENFVSSNGDYAGTVINSSNMLWSLSGNIALVYRIFFGMEFQEGGIQFRPFVPTAFAGKRSLRNFKYRDAILDIEMVGSGNVVEEFQLDGEVLEKPGIPNNLKGNHVIKIALKSEGASVAKTNSLDETTSPETPVAEIKGNNLIWKKIEGAVGYKVVENGKALGDVAETSFSIQQKSYAEYQVIALDKAGNESFASEPVRWNPAGAQREIFLTKEAPKSDIQAKGFQGKGYVEISTVKNKSLSFIIPADEAGTYAISFRYANGNGPINTENKCAIRSLRSGGALKGTFVFPQRGIGEWSNWGNSNAVQVQLEKGNHTFQLVLEPSNENMNGSVNQALLNFVQVEKLK